MENNNRMKITFTKILIATYLISSVIFFVVFYTNHKPQQLSSVTNYAEDVRKIQNNDLGFIYYSLHVSLIDESSVDSSTGEITGRFYFWGDTSKHLYRFAISPNGLGEYTIGYFTEKPTTVEVWERLTKNDFLNTIKMDKEAYLTVSLRSNFDQDLEYSKDLDETLEMYKGGNGVPNSFVFKITSINLKKD